METKARCGDGCGNDRFAGDVGSPSQGIASDDVWQDAKAISEFGSDRGDRRDVSVYGRCFDSRRRDEVWTIRHHLRSDRFLAGRFRQHASAGEEWRAGFVDRKSTRLT